jgi:hypothetical protein
VHLRTRRVLSILAVFALLCAGLMAQKKTREERREEANSRSLQGLVTDPDNKPVSGAVVQLKDQRTLQVRSFITQQDGMYRFFGLKIDTDYQLTVKSGELSAGPRALSVFDSRKEAIINLKLEGKPAEPKP